MSTNLSDVLGDNMRRMARRLLPNAVLPYVRWLCGVPEPAGLSIGERRRIERMPRHRPGETSLFGTPVSFVDSASFLSMHREIFGRRLYDFATTSATPYVIDAGANIGLGCIFLKRRFPQARIDAFEPDPEVFETLRRNADAFELQGVTLHKNGVWDSECTISFQRDGADGGRIPQSDTHQETLCIETTRLKVFLEKAPVEFLKLDIEGAETRVLLDCRNALFNVKNLFVEYHSFDGCDQTLDEVLGCLRHAGFRYHIHLTGVASPFPFRKRVVDNGMDMQLNIFAYRPDDPPIHDILR